MILYGALTAKPSAFRYRPWELQEHAGLDLHDAYGSNVSIYTRGTDLMRILPRINTRLNQNLITDKVRFSFDARLKQRLQTPYMRLTSEKESSKQLIPISNKLALNVFTKLNIEAQRSHVLLGAFTSIEQHQKLNEYHLSILNKNKLMLIKAEKTPANVDYLPQSSDIVLANRLTDYDVILLIATDIRRDLPLLYYQLIQHLNDNPMSTCYSVCSKFPPLANVIDLGTTYTSLINVSFGQSPFNKTLIKTSKTLVIQGISTITQESLLDFITGHIIKNHLVNYTVNNLKYASSSDDTLSLIAAIKTPATVAQLALANEFNLVFDFLINLNVIKSHLINVNYDNVKVISENYSHITYFGSHADRSVKAADLILPVPSLYEFRGTYFNYQYMMQVMPRIINNSIYPQSFLDIYYIQLFFFNNLKRQNFNRLAGQIKKHAFQRSLTGLLGTELKSQYKFKVFKKHNLIYLTTTSQILCEQLGVINSEKKLFIKEDYIHAIKELSINAPQKFNLPITVKYTKRHKFNGKNIYMNFIKSTDAILNKTKQIELATTNTPLLSDSFTRNSLNLALATLHFTSSNLNFKI